MKYHVHQYFQIGTLSWMSYEGISTEAGISAIAQDEYFQAIEISNTEIANRERVKAMLQQSHLRVIYGVQPIQLRQQLNPNAIAEEERQMAERELIRWIEEAHHYQAERFVFMAGSWRKDTCQKQFEQLVKTTKRLCRYARQYGMKMELEVFDYDMDKKVLIGNSELAAQLAETVRADDPSFGLVVDLSHIPLMHESIDEVMTALMPYTTHYHIGNAVIDHGFPAFGDQHPRFGYPHSEIDTIELSVFLRRIWEARQERTEDCFLSFEVKPQQGENRKTVLMGCKRTLNEAWKMV